MKYVSIVAVAMVVILGVVAVSNAQSNDPVSYWGTVTIDGEDAPVGTIVRVYVDGELVDEYTLTQEGILGSEEEPALEIEETSGDIVITIESDEFNDGEETEYGEIVDEGEVVLDFESEPEPSPTPIPTPTRMYGPATERLGGYGDPANLARYNYREGYVISARGSNDPDVYIVNEWGYKRLFLNPVIFEFYGHLGGWHVVRSASPQARDAFPTSGLFRNCETYDERVFAVEVTGEDTGTLHHIQMTGEAAAAEDPDFFRRIFCINNNEFNWYSKSPAPYTSLSQIPYYTR